MITSSSPLSFECNISFNGSRREPRHTERRKEEERGTKRRGGDRERNCERETRAVKHQAERGRERTYFRKR